MSDRAIFVSNQRSAYKVVEAAVSMNKTISSTPIVPKTDSAFLAGGATPLHPDTQVLLVQINTNDVYLSLHNEAPSATTALVIVAGSIIELSLGQWLNSQWQRVTSDAVLVAMQLRPS